MGPSSCCIKEQAKTRGFFLRIFGGQRKYFFVVFLSITNYTLRSAVLLNVLEHAAKLGRRGDSVLSFIHDFVESRVELIRSAKVCKNSEVLT